MYSCLYNNCADINLFLYVCKDDFSHTSGTSFRGIVIKTTTLLLPCLWIDGNQPRAFLIKDTTEIPLIPGSVPMSYGLRTRDDDARRPFRTYAGTPDGSWPTEIGGPVTCQSGFLGSTDTCRLFSGLLQTLGLLRQRTWLWHSWSLLYMSSTSMRGVTWCQRVSHGAIFWGTCIGSIEYHIIFWTPLRSFLTMQLMPILVMSLPTRRLLSSSSGPEILPICSKSSTEWEAEWSMHCRFLRWFQIHSFWAYWRASGPIRPCLTRCRLRKGGVGVHGSRF